MEQTSDVVYLTCTRHRSLQKKHIDVCRQCQWNATCEPYQEYCSSKVLAKRKEPPQSAAPQPISEDLADYIRNELGEIRTILENRTLVENQAAPLLRTPPPFRDDVLEVIKEELREIKTLC